jgi:hypothetical protein
MAQDIGLEDAFALDLLNKAQVLSDDGSRPRAHYSADGDCIEIVFSRENYRAERLSDLLTIYVERERGGLVGLLLKGVKPFIQQLLSESPGFQIEIVDGKVRLVYLVTAAIWKSSDGTNDQVKLNVFRKIREEVKEAKLDDLKLDLQPC